jgi:dihydroorotate dehydrogenase
MKNLAIANSIGIASTTLNTSLQDINDARMILQPGQILIASIYGEKNEKRSILDDWAHLARHVVQAGAHIVEANVSCPNIGHSTPLYLDPVAIAELVKQLVNTINPIPLVIKVGTFPDKQLMEQVMIAAARAGAQGICGINGFSMHVVDEHNNPVFGESRKTCGVSGAPIFNLALDWIKNAYAINKKHNLGLTIMGTGGITHAEQFDAFLYAGASVAMSATGTMWDPYLAARYLHEKYYTQASHTLHYSTNRNYPEHNKQ